MTFHSNDTSLRNMTCNSSIQNHNFMSFFLLLVEIEYEISFKWYLLEKYDTKHFYSKSKFSQFCAYFSLKLEWKFIEKRPSGRIRHIILLFQIKFFRFCAYFWHKLLWHFIQRIPPWELWRVTLQFNIIISWVFAYC